ncbi:carboxypeptidase C [Chaetomium sp. MPI-SDFR-AT-0129]|nr:carboxypeptidase C [Chaetomium sp. MPI-SDFR-AT-0129]
MRSGTLFSSGLVCALSSLIPGAHAQFPPPREGITVVQSKFHENLGLSFKEPGICETTPGVKSYSGYVHLPPNFLGGEGLQDFPINTFFWFFEARKDPANAPLAIWLNGGPGSSSMMGLLEENGPCFVGADSQSTYLNPWSWNNEVNMLYIDQPVQTGFSYDVPTNVTVQLSEDNPSTPIITPTDFGGDAVPATNYTFQIGTVGSQKWSQTTNTTELSAHALWHFLQTWLADFPHYSSADDRISLWAESYGGHYGPGIFRFFQAQNKKLATGNGRLKERYPGARRLHLDTLGLINGAVDWEILAEAGIEFPVNNTYDLQLYNTTYHAALQHNWTRPDGWRDRLLTCRSAIGPHPIPIHTDPSDPPAPPPLNDTITAFCSNLSHDLNAALLDTFPSISGRAQFDIAHPRRDPFPPPHLYGYLTSSSTLAALGVPVNYSAVSEAANQVFEESFDILRGGYLETLAALLDEDVNDDEEKVQVHLVYGDRDYGANWLNGERTSLAVPWRGAEGFAEALYTPLVLTPGEGGDEDEDETSFGLTRQTGRFSFTRVFQSGHEVPAYQPAAAHAIFQRANARRDIATGRVRVDEEYTTDRGLRDAWTVRSTVPEFPRPRCYVLVPGSCEPEVWRTVVDGTAVVKDYFVVGRRGEDGGEVYFEYEDDGSQRVVENGMDSEEL